MPFQIHVYWIFYHQNMKNSQIKTDIVHIFAQNIDCGYSLESPRWSGTNEYQQSMFLSRTKTNNVYPYKPQFYCAKVGFKGGQLYIGMFSWCLAIQNEPSENSDQTARMRSIIRIYWAHMSKSCSLTDLFNPVMPSGLFYRNSLDRPISNIRGIWLVVIITMFYRNSCIWYKQCIPWSDAAFCGVWSGSIRFPMSLLWDARHKWVKQRLAASQSCRLCCCHKMNNKTVFLCVFCGYKATHQHKYSDNCFLMNYGACGLWIYFFINPCPAEPGYSLPLQTV